MNPDPNQLRDQLRELVRARRDLEVELGKVEAEIDRTWAALDAWEVRIYAVPEELLGPVEHPRAGLTPAAKDRRKMEREAADAAAAIEWSKRHAASMERHQQQIRDEQKRRYMAQIEQIWEGGQA